MSKLKSGRFFQILLPFQKTSTLGVGNFQGRIQPKYVNLRFSEKATKFEKKKNLTHAFDELYFPLKF